MKNCLILGGTSDTKNILKQISDKYSKIYVSVATDYGYELFSDLISDGIELCKIQFTEDTLRDFLSDKEIEEIIDTTHPYATKITELAQNIAKICNVKYIDRKRGKFEPQDMEEGVIFVHSYEDAVSLVENQDLLPTLITTGSKNANKFKTIAHNSYIRILPTEESIKKVKEAGFPSKNIIAMQGPFSVELNLSLINQFNIRSMITKNSGKEGGLTEKLKSSKIAKIPLIVVENEY
ncbi:MAG: precorrin-6A reductase [Calditerrivibrio sp.]|nr:precorrin-6A reductase [Calditerrivibrio sp.]